MIYHEYSRIQSMILCCYEKIHILKNYNVSKIFLDLYNPETIIIFQSKDLTRIEISTENRARSVQRNVSAP